MGNTKNHIGYQIQNPLDKYFFAENRKPNAQKKEKLQTEKKMKRKKTTIFTKNVLVRKLKNGS